MRLRELFSPLKLLPLIIGKLDLLMTKTDELLAAEGRVEAAVAAAATALRTQAATITDLSAQLAAAHAAGDDSGVQAVIDRLNALPAELTAAIPTPPESPAAPADPATAPAEAPADDASPATA